MASVLAFGALGIFGAVPAWADSTVVQVMSVTNQASAAAEVERLTAQGVPAFQRGEQVTGIGLRYRVYLGPFDTAQEATGAAEALKGSGLIKEYIVRSESPSASNYSAAPPAATQAQPGQPALPAQPGPVAPVGQAPPSQEYWPPSPGTAPAQTGQAPAPAPSTEEYWPPLPGADPPAPANQNDWP
ncbi:MAG: SPOR domain-containing protein, partial [Deltaproteobacteria bacterium]|nr:SPOR domain-containing protein [Deltaproteobacteria bacterium]